MKRPEKAERIQGILDELIGEPEIPLDHRDPYTLLVAVLLSAQCTDERVNKVTPGLFGQASTPAEMQMLSVATIHSAIRTCGLAPQKSKAIHELSKILVREYDSVVPDSLEDLESLPGVGHKTASVVMCQGFGQVAFPVDTHIHRLAARWGLSSGRSVVHTERDLKKVFAPDTWNKLHLQIIHFGRRFCPARGHDLTECPICSWAATKTRIATEMRKG